jgi:hydroxylamine dehydrogenase
MRAKPLGWSILLMALGAGAGSLRLPAAAQQIVPEIKEPQGVQEAEECVKCHQKVTPGLVAAFQASSMGHGGIQNPAVYEEVRKQRAPKEKTEKRKAFLVRNGQITCVLCHGDNHTTITETRGRVANAVCGGCHDAIDQEYEKGGGHSFDAPEENFKLSLAAPEFFGVPSAVLELSRDRVFSQQGATAPPYFDPDPEFEGTALIHRNGCVPCHTRHRFDVAEARRPESCETCHSHAVNSAFDAYLRSKHGSIYRAESAGWDWKSRMPEALPRGGYATPTCATCHMLEAERYGDVKLTHKMTTKSIWGRGLQPLLVEAEQATEPGYKAFFQQVRQQGDAKRKAMILICRNCHSEKFAGDYLNACDEVKLAADLLVLRARSVLDGLVRDKLLPVSAVALASSTEKKNLDRPLTAIEQAYLHMARYENVRTALGAFHGSPGDVYWEGYARLQKSLAHIQRLEKEMRETTRK